MLCRDDKDAARLVGVMEERGWGVGLQMEERWS